MTISEINQQSFFSPTKGHIDFETVIRNIANEILQHRGDRFVVSVGTDSEHLQEVIKFVSVLVLWKVGHGAKCWRVVNESFANKKIERGAAMRDRIFQEIMLTGTLAQETRSALAQHWGGELPMNIEVHADVGENGGTSVMMREVIGMLRGYGFDDAQIKVKPESYAASSVADHYI